MSADPAEAETEAGAEAEAEAETEAGADGGAETEAEAAVDGDAAPADWTGQEQPESGKPAGGTAG